MKKHWAISLSVVVVALAGCGGGGGDSNAPPATAQVPAAASMSVGGFMTYVHALVASMADTLEPVDVSAVTPPTDETSEPVAVH